MGTRYGSLFKFVMYIKPFLSVVHLDELSQ
jgi:hypothetical protein